MVELSILELMESALGQLAVRYPNRSGKAFYLGSADWLDFLATDPPMIDTIWNCLPAHEYSFMDIPVRLSKNVGPRKSRLYDHTGCGRELSAIIKPDGRAVVTDTQREALAKARTRKWSECDLLHGEELVASLGDGGYMTWESSPLFMWLGRRIALAKKRGG